MILAQKITTFLKIPLIPIAWLGLLFWVQSQLENKLFSPGFLHIFVQIMAILMVFTLIRHRIPFFLGTGLGVLTLMAMLFLGTPIIFISLGFLLYLCFLPIAGLMTIFSLRHQQGVRAYYWGVCYVAACAIALRHITHSLHLAFPPEWLSIDTLFLFLIWVLPSGLLVGLLINQSRIWQANIMVPTPVDVEQAKP